METRANYIFIGLFVLAVMAGAAGFVYWLYSQATGGTSAPLRIVFTEPVTGLTSGSQVMFNGIRVGEVRSLGFAPGSGTNVVALCVVDASAPIKVDSQAQLGTQGLTGVSYVSLTGGTPAAPSLFAPAVVAKAPGGIPTLVAKPSDFQDIMKNARSLLARADSTLTTLNEVVAQNQPRINATMGNVERFSGALAAASPQISQLITDVGGAGRALAAAGPGFSSLVDKVGGLVAEVPPGSVHTIVANAVGFSNQLASLGTGIGSILADAKAATAQIGTITAGVNQALAHVDRVVQAIPADEVAGIVKGLNTTVASIAAEGGAIQTLIANANGAVGATRKVVDALSANSGVITATIADAHDTLANVKAASAQFPALVAAARPAVDKLAAVGNAIDPAAITAAVANVTHLTGALAAQSGAIAPLVAHASTVVGNLDALTASLAAKREAITATLDNVAGITRNARAFTAALPDLLKVVQPAVASLGAVAHAVDPNAVAAITANLTHLTTTLSAQSDAIAPLMANATAAAGNLNAVAGTLAAKNQQIAAVLDNAAALSSTLPQVSATLGKVAAQAGVLVASIAPDQVRGIVANAGALVADLRAQSGALAAIVANATDATKTLDAVTKAVAARTGDITATLANARALTGSLTTTAQALQPTIARADTLLSSVDPKAVAATIANVTTTTSALAAQAPALGRIVTNTEAATANADRVTAALAAQGPAIKEIVANAQVAAHNLAAVSAEVAPAIERVSTALGAFDPQVVKGIVAGLHNIVGVVSAQSGKIGAAIENTAAATANLRTFSDTVVQQKAVVADIGARLRDAATTLQTASHTVLTGAEALTGVIKGPAGSFFVEANAAAQKVNAIASAFSSRAESIASSLDRFATQGLSNVTNLVTQANRTLTTIQRTVTNIGENPSSVLLGGSNGPTFTPRRR